MFSENFAHYEIMWKNMVQPVSPQVTIYCGTEKMLECRYPLVIFNTYCLSKLHKCTSVLYVPCLLVTECINDVMYVCLQK